MVLPVPLPGTTKKPSLYHKTNRRFSLQEDKQLKELVSIYGEHNWTLIAEKMKKRNSRQCKDRWVQYLSPHANQTPWTAEEEERLKKLVVDLNGKWIEIAKHFNGRADSQIRNKWRTLQRRAGMLQTNRTMAPTYPIPHTHPIPFFQPFPVVQQNVQKNNSQPEVETSPETCDISFDTFEDDNIEDSFFIEPFSVF